MEDTPQVSSADVNIILKTPLVTDAWIDTPLPTGGRGPPMPTPSDAQDQKQLGNGNLGAAELIHRLSPSAITERPKLQNQAPLKYSGPPLPKSALQDILNDARAPKQEKQPKRSPSNSESEEDPTLHLGDSTIQSLEDLIVNDEDFSTLLAPTPPPETDPSSSEPSPSSQALTTGTRSSDLQSYTHLLTRLTNFAPSLRASKNQLASLERTISSSSPSVHQTTTTDPTTQPAECPEAGEFHDFIWPCQRCGCPGRMDPPNLQPLLSLRDHITTLTIPLPRLWRPRRPHDSLPRLTPLGLFTLLAYALYFAEMSARARFCHPVYARSMVGYGVDINAPRPPFVLVKVLYMYTSFGTVAAPFWHLVRAVVRLMAGLVGYLVGVLVGDGDGGMRQPVSRDSRIPRPEWGPDLRMMDDEFL